MMILFASDFGHAGPYVGQVHAVLARQAPGVPVIDLMHDLPAFRPAAAGCLIRQIIRSMVPAATAAPVYESKSAGDIVLAVVDPGVGTARDPVIVETPGTRYVGPDNGLFAAVFEREPAQVWRIDWRPKQLSDSFHGRDLFAPVAAKLARGQPVARTQRSTSDLVRPDAPDPLAEVIYCDRYGNAMTGLEARGLADDVVLTAGEHRFKRARTFGEVPVGTGLWFANSLGLAEIAVNQGSAAEQFDLAVGSPVVVGG